MLTSCKQLRLNIDLPGDPLVKAIRIEFKGVGGWERACVPACVFVLRSSTCSLLPGFAPNNKERFHGVTYLEVRQRTPFTTSLQLYVDSSSLLDTTLQWLLSIGLSAKSQAVRDLVSLPLVMFFP